MALFRKSRLIRTLRAEIQRLRETLARTEAHRDALQNGYDDMRNIAAKAIDVAHEKHFPPAGLVRQDRDLRPLNETVNSYLPNYIAPTVKHCPECTVSVRAESWPQECPVCHCTFGFEEGG